MTQKRAIIGMVILAGVLFFPLTIRAQEMKTIDENVLQALYREQLRNPDDQFILKRIADERASIRDLIDEELQKSVAPPSEEVEIDSVEMTKALDRQRQVIAVLQECLNEHEVDLELLLAEELRFYLQPSSDTGAMEAEQFRSTKTHEGLLAKKAILEERIAALDLILKQQQQRLSRLVQEQRLLQFGMFTQIGKYLLIILIVWFLERLIRLQLLSRIRKGDRRYTVTKAFTSVVYVMMFLWLIGRLFAENPGVLASFAIVGAALAIALQDVVKDIVGWLIILQNRLFSPGDRVSIGTLTGEVVDIRILRTTLLEVGFPPQGVLEHTGKLLSIPNSTFLIQAVTNHSTISDFVNSEIHITVTFESDWKRAKQILEEVVNEETNQFTEREKLQQVRRARMLFMPRQITGPRVYTDIAADGVDFTVRFSVPIGEKRPVVTSLSEQILARFDQEPGIELAYKTVRYYHQGEERT